MSLPLQGVRVLDLTIALAGPYCSMTLGDLGADVVKVEPPAGDQARGWGPPFAGSDSTYFLAVNRNKRSAVLDLRTDEGRAAARRLALESDVLVQNLRPGAAERAGLGAAELRAVAPGLVHCSISGYGPDRPDLPGYDQVVQGTAGLMSLTGLPDGPPGKVGVPIADLASGMFAVQAILAALYERERTGVGSTIQVPMQDSVMALLVYQAGRYFATGEAPRREGNFHATVAPYGAFPTADGWINIAVGSDAQFAGFCRVLQLDHLVEDVRFRTNRDRQVNREALHEQFVGLLASRSTADWQAALTTAGIPAGPILDLAEVFEQPDYARAVLTVQHPEAGAWRTVAPPWRFDGQPPQARRPPPRLGEHTSEILAGLGGREVKESDAASDDQRLGG